MRLNDVFANVKRHYFPRWVPGSTWAARAESRASYTLESGYCDRVNKAILVAPIVVANGGPNLVATVIHESCHAVTQGGHGQRFCIRMAKAAARARGLGERKVAEIIELEVEQYARGAAEMVRAADVYRRMGNMVAEYGDSLGYTQLCEAIAGSNGQTVEELERRFRRLRRVYERELRYQKRQSQLEAKFEALFKRG